MHKHTLVRLNDGGDGRLVTNDRFHRGMMATGLNENMKEFTSFVYLFIYLLTGSMQKTEISFDYPREQGKPEVAADEQRHVE